jgi:hypothetical protein
VAEWQQIEPEKVHWAEPTGGVCDVFCDCSGTIPDTAPLVYIDDEFRHQCHECGRVYRVVFTRHVEVLLGYPRQEGQA